jgi:hypothetical protein
LLARSAVGKIVSVTVIRHGGHRHQIDITPIQD